MTSSRSWGRWRRRPGFLRSPGRHPDEGEGHNGQHHRHLGDLRWGEHPGRHDDADDGQQDRHGGAVVEEQGLRRLVDVGEPAGLSTVQTGHQIVQRLRRAARPDQRQDGQEPPDHGPDDLGPRHPDRAGGHEGRCPSPRSATGARPGGRRRAPRPVRHRRGWHPPGRSHRHPRRTTTPRGTRRWKGPGPACRSAGRRSRRRSGTGPRRRWRWSGWAGGRRSRRSR